MKHESRGFCGHQNVPAVSVRLTRRALYYRHSIVHIFTLPDARRLQSPPSRGGVVVEFALGALGNPSTATETSAPQAAQVARSNIVLL